MRPILLRIAGLNSFREAQEIDFQKLCETGVFGIFGSTGSGKSTILDAITLALYGTVERAANNTQGILNHAEAQLTVEYSFSLALGGKRVIYRAERAYRRSGDRTVKASTCRLVEISDGIESVLASKADEMTKKIEGVLGLTVEDFTRAVVLPQGKFAEFLTIKPKDRRLMLERLFSLEAYGRELSARLSDQLGSTEYDLHGVDQRQQGLGDASEGRVKAAETDLLAANVTSASLAEELKDLKQQYDVAKELWGLQEQLRQIQEKETQLSGAQAKMDSMAERLNRAERAETIRAYLDELRLSEERFKGAKEHVEEADKNLKVARLAKETAEGKWSTGNQERLEVEPHCLRRLEQLEQAKSLEVDIQVRQERLNNSRLKYGELDRTRKELEKKIEVAKAQKVEIQNQQLDVKIDLTKVTIDPAQRTRVNASAQALEGFEMVSKQVDDLQRDLAKNAAERENLKDRMNSSAAEVQTARGSVEQLKETLADRLQNPPLREELLSDQAQKLERYRHRIANVGRAEQEMIEEQARLLKLSADRQRVQVSVESGEMQQNEILAAVQKTLDSVERKTSEVRSLEQKNLAGLLVATLVEGKACPVCGSSHHPEPAQSLTDAYLDRARQELEQASQELQSWEGKRANSSTSLAVAKAQLVSIQESEQTQFDILEVKKHAIVNYRRELPELDRGKDIQTLNAQLAEQESNLTKDRRRLSQWHTHQEELNRQLEDALQKLADVDKKLQSTHAQIASTEGVGKEILHRLNQLLEEKTRRKEHLDTLRGEIPSTEIPVMQKQYATWDQTMTTLNLKLTRLEEGLKGSDEAQQRLLQQKTECELELQNLKTVGSEAARDLAELKIKCDVLTEGKPALERIEKVQQTLELVTRTEETLKAAYEVSKEVWIQAEQTLAINHKTLELSREGFEVAQFKLDQGLKTAQFLTVSEAQNALCNAAERQTMDQNLLAFRQDVLITKQKREAAEERLMGRSLRPEEWLAWPVLIKKVENSYTEAMESRGAAQQRVEKLKEEHEEWVRLERQRQVLSHRRGLLKRLQTVFKGNAFIEFMAQEQLTNVSLDASERLRQLTNQRYALEVDAEGGFIMRDDANGGVRRPVSSLSGGETFLTALALALALSTQIQLRGESPLEFFFLDEGFGTLDANLLETVMNTLEVLHLQNLSIGIISHVPELKNRLARRLVVTPAEAGGAGSKVQLEMA
ncbi:AAA family ATPase [Desulfosporosinus sp. Sb-LF]|uniref:AAA family ATPase n=1 Tax=Desulfosporosinus sp. Sb-LF TaxID=2560027 RepID=UPI00107F7C15|nr:AAA family ATPase [Desulfosporosinus sp. Sb-LF]TGE31518.1 ATPase [Desulfosporosinus sp. Sb-LF]